MAFSLSMPHSATGWAEFPGDLVRAIRETLIAHPFTRRELSPEERAHRIAMERLMLERSNATLTASRWPR